MINLDSLTTVQLNVLIASIIGDGEITKIYKNTRRKNHSYREHYGIAQENYRKWKITFFDNLLYITPKSSSVRSASHPLFTTLYPHFYSEDGVKHLPFALLNNCNLPHFLAILYMDDGSLSISYRINHLKKLIYLLPHIYLYLQCYALEDLMFLKEHIKVTFDINFHISSRRDGKGFILKTTSVKETYKFLETIFPVTNSCNSMYYKTSWTYRFAQEQIKWKAKLPEYTILASDSERFKPYTKAETVKLRELKDSGFTTQEIADALKRSYWSVTAKWREIKDHE